MLKEPVFIKIANKKQLKLVENLFQSLNVTISPHLYDIVSPEYSDNVYICNIGELNSEDFYKDKFSWYTRTLVYHRTLCTMEDVYEYIEKCKRTKHYKIRISNTVYLDLDIDTEHEYDIHDLAREAFYKHVKVEAPACLSAFSCTRRN